MMCSCLADVCPITASTGADALRPGTVSAAPAMGPVTLEPPVTPVSTDSSLHVRFILQLPFLK